MEDQREPFTDPDNITVTNVESIKKDPNDEAKDRIQKTTSLSDLTEMLDKGFENNNLTILSSRSKVDLQSVISLIKNLITTARSGNPVDMTKLTSGGSLRDHVRYLARKEFPNLQVMENESLEPLSAEMIKNTKTYLELLHLVAKHTKIQSGNSTGAPYDQNNTLEALVTIEHGKRDLKSVTRSQGIRKQARILLAESGIHPGDPDMDHFSDSVKKAADPEVLISQLESIGILFANGKTIPVEPIIQLIRAHVSSKKFEGLFSPQPSVLENISEVFGIQEKVASFQIDKAVRGPNTEMFPGGLLPSDRKPTIEPDTRGGAIQNDHGESSQNIGLKLSRWFSNKVNRG